ncbi:transposase [Streptomyces sp. NBC_01197]|uniref:transposase n=1 Tax=Streptomyces sp. NBC_01197 TaxID=2903768 RepID=UPI003FA3C80B
MGVACPVIPRARTGRPRAEHRRIINGIVYKIRAGISWRGLPNAMDRGRRCTPASAATRSTASSPGRCSRSRPRRTPTAAVPPGHLPQAQHRRAPLQPARRFPWPRDHQV